MGSVHGAEKRLIEKKSSKIFCEKSANRPVKNLHFPEQGVKEKKRSRESERNWSN